MYRCRDCLTVFNKPKVILEKHGLDCPPYETVDVCPTCGGSDYEITVRCSCCGEYTAGRHVVTNDKKYYCDGCFYIVDWDDE